MDKLARSASGLRHLRWGREILATLRAHLEKNPTLSEGEREELRREAAALSVLVDALSGAVKPYRDFLERTRTGLRGAERVAAFLGDEAIQEAAHRQMDAAEQSVRRPLKIVLGKAITGLRMGLEEMDLRLMRTFSEPFIASLYPELARGDAFVADEDDEDDDATAPRG